MLTSKLISRILSILMIFMLTLAWIGPVEAAPPSASAAALDPSQPTQTVKLIFIHHSTGENWLTDGNGNLGDTLGKNNYFVSDTNYGWGPDAIGDHTDIPNWTEWFSSANTSTYMNALYNEIGQNSSYTRTLANPGGENRIIMFKSCFPNSALEGNPNDPPSASGWLTVGHAKYVYNQILQYFGAHPEKLFVVITAPPLRDGTYAANARAFNEWLMNNWLTQNSYTGTNVAVFDFYNVLTGPNNYHRYYNGAIEHVFTPGMNTSYYPSGDDHPSVAGSQKATSEFVSLLNIFYHRWKSGLTNAVPIVNSSTLASPNPTTASSVGFTVTFSKAVSGVDKTDFTLTASPSISGHSVFSVTPVSTSVYTVTVNTGIGSGIIHLNVVDDDSIVDGSSNPLGGPGSDNGNFTSGETYLVRPSNSLFLPLIMR